MHACMVRNFCYIWYSDNTFSNPFGFLFEFYTLYSLDELWLHASFHHLVAVLQQMRREIQIILHLRGLRVRSEVDRRK